MRNNMEFNKEIVRIEIGSFTALYDGRDDKFVLGFLNADKMSKEDLKHLYKLTGQMLKQIERNEEHKNS